MIIEEVVFVVGSFERRDGHHERTGLRRCEAIMKDEDPLKCRTHKFVEVGLFFQVYTWIFLSFPLWIGSFDR